MKCRGDTLAALSDPTPAWENRMNGAENLLETLVTAGVEVCFANPGTSEMHLVQAIDAVDGMRPVLCLFEGVCSGAADGFARMSGRPATTLLHLGAGLGNAVANLHNARRAATPLLNIVGDHARQLLLLRRRPPSHPSRSTRSTRAAYASASRSSMTT